MSLAPGQSGESNSGVLSHMARLFQCPPANCSFSVALGWFCRCSGSQAFYLVVILIGAVIWQHVPFTGGLFQWLGQRQLSGSKGLNLQALVPLALHCVVVGWSLRAPVLTIRTRGPALRRAKFVVRCAHIVPNLALLRAGPCALR